MVTSYITWHWIHGAGGSTASYSSRDKSRSFFNGAESASAVITVNFMKRDNKKEKVWWMPRIWRYFVTFFSLQLFISLFFWHVDLFRRDVKHFLAGKNKYFMFQITLMVFGIFIHWNIFSFWGYFLGQLNENLWFICGWLLWILLFYAFKFISIYDMYFNDFLQMICYLGARK